MARVSYATSLMRQGVLISTTEHLLSVFYSMGVDNAYVEIDNLEVPILDGSGSPYVELLNAAGLKSYRRRKRFLRIRRPVTVEAGSKRITILPSDRFLLTCDVFYDHPLIGKQSLDMEVTPERYAQEIAPARTFGFAHELDQMRDMGLIRGAALENAMCFDRAGRAEPGRFALSRRMLPAQSAGSDRRPGADRQAAARPRDRRTRRTRDAHRAGGAHHVRSIAL